MFSIGVGQECIHSISIARRVVNQKCVLQYRSYRPKRLSRNDWSKICRQTKPFVPSPEHELTQDWQTRPHVIKSYQRVAWARFGLSSGVNISDLLPSKDDIQEEWQAEKQWWPTLQEMRDEKLKTAKLQEREKQSYEKRVAENMAQMPKWIEQWEKDERKRMETDVVRAKKRDAMTEKALEDFNYIHTADSPEVKDYIVELREQERKEKRMMKKLAKTQSK